jgi:RNA ligase (TIGR02306 family)
LVGINLNGNVGGTNSKGPKNPPPVYDVESFKNFRNAFEPGEQVVVTEKIHGSNARFLFDGKTFFVGSRKLWKSEKSNCVWRQAVKQHPWIEEFCRKTPGVTLYGEVFPTQGDKFRYGCKDGEVGFRAFDVLDASGVYVPVYDLADTTQPFPNTWVPVLYSGPFDEAKIKELVDGPSTIPGAKNIREGVVVRPVVERHVHGLGRLQLKLVSCAFLLQSE